MATLLVIEDDLPMLKLCGTVLTAAGYNVALAGDGREGLAAFDREKPDVVITDILMPDQDGLETIRAIRRQDSRVGIIAMSSGWSSGRGEAGHIDLLGMAQRMGACCALPKPFTFIEMLEKVNQCLAMERPAKPPASDRVVPWRKVPKPRR